MTTVPYCNVEVATPIAKPASPQGIVSIPASSSLSQVINYLNQNFSKLIKGNYTEDKSARQTQIVRIYDPSNHSSFVDVKQVTAVTWVNSTTGQKIVWQR